MKKAFALLIIFSVFLTVGGAFASQVTNVELNYNNGFTQARIDVQGTVRFSHQTEIAKDGKPFRIILDVLSATHDLGANNFLALPECPIQGLRTSQYSVKPEKVTRLVFDMKKETFYQVSSDEKSITISFPDKNSKVFQVWSTTHVVSELKKSQTQEKPAVAVKTEPAPAKETPAREKTWVDKNSSMDQDRQLSLKGSEPETKKSAVPEPKVTKPEDVNKDVPKQPIFDENNLPPLVQNQALSLNTKAEEKKQATIDKPAVKKEEKIAVAKVETKKSTEPTDPTPVKSDKPATTDVKTEPAKAKSETPVTTIVKTEPVKAISEKPTTTVAKIEPTVEHNNVPLMKKEEPKAQPNNKETKSAFDKSTQPVQLVSTTEDKPQVITEAKPAVKNTETNSDVSGSDDTKNEENETEAEAEAEAIDKDVDKKSTSRFRRSPSTPTKIKGTLVAEFPQRLVIKYQPFGRDPFETLINESRVNDNPIEQRIANVEGLRLVGVIESDNKINSALFEDKDSYGYILKEGDKVRNGYVLRIEPEEVYFQLFEYGWSRTLSLKMENQ
ncbi:MAG: hypothetical protein ABIJ12_01620 [bacterium]